MKMYYRLLLAVIRLISSVVLSRGEQNERTMEQARRFLSENRAAVVALFKRDGRLGDVQADLADELNEVVENLVLLISMTRFLDVSRLRRVAIERLTWNRPRRNRAHRPRARRECLPRTHGSL